MSKIKREDVILLAEELNVFFEEDNQIILNKERTTESIIEELIDTIDPDDYWDDLSPEARTIMMDIEMVPDGGGNMMDDAVIEELDFDEDDHGETIDVDDEVIDIEESDGDDREEGEINAKNEYGADDIDTSDDMDDNDVEDDMDDPKPEEKPKKAAKKKAAPKKAAKKKGAKKKEPAMVVTAETLTDEIEEDFLPEETGLPERKEFIAEKKELPPEESEDDEVEAIHQDKDGALLLDRKRFIEVLDMVKPGIAKKEIVDQSTHFAFQKDIIRTFNDYIAVSQRFTTNIRGCAKADNIYKLLKKMKDPTITMSEGGNPNNTQNGRTIELSGSKLKASIMLEGTRLPNVDFPAHNHRQWIDISDGFLDGVKFAANSAGDDSNRVALTCLYVENDRIYSCNSISATEWRMAESMHDTFTIPAKSAIQMLNYNPTKYISSKTWTHFQNEERTVFSSRTLNIEYPISVIKSLFDKENGEYIELPTELKGIVDRVSIFATAESDFKKYITLTIENNVLTCTGEGVYGKTIESTPINYNGKKIEVKVHPANLSQILNHLDRMMVSESKLTFRGDDYDHVIGLTV